MEKLKRELMIQRIIIGIMCVVLVVLSIKTFDFRIKSETNQQEAGEIGVSNQQKVNELVDKEEVEELEETEEIVEVIESTVTDADLKEVPVHHKNQFCRYVLQL